MKLTQKGTGSYRTNAVHFLAEPDLLPSAGPTTCAEACFDDECIRRHFHVWSVYEDQADKSVQCVADCETAEDAERIAAALHHTRAHELRGGLERPNILRQFDKVASILKTTIVDRLRILQEGNAAEREAMLTDDIEYQIVYWKSIQRELSAVTSDRY